MSASFRDTEEVAFIAGLSKPRADFVRALQREAKKYDPEHRDAFCRLVAEFERVVSRHEIASEFGISPATVSRWIAGRTAPAPFVRQAILNRLASIAETIIKDAEVAPPYSRTKAKSGLSA